MTAKVPERPDMNDDDIARAYAQSHVLADDGRGPSAAVRANVLAAAREIAAESAARVAVEQAAPLAVTPVAPPVAAVGRRRAPAINLSSWRVRSGAALCAVLLVGMVSWRFDSEHRLSGGVQVALAELRLAEPPTAAAPAELPVPPLSGASFPYATPPPVVADPLDNGTAAKAAAVQPAARDKYTIVAQAEQQPAPAPRAAAPVDAARRATPAAAVPLAADAAPPPAPVVVASNAPAAYGAPAEQSQAVTVTAPAPVQIITSGAMPPSVVQRRIALIPKPAPTIVAAATTPAPAPTTIAAAPAPTQAPVAAAAAAAPPSFGETTIASADPAHADAVAKPAFSSDALKKASPELQGSLIDTRARLSPPPLQAAADRGDVEALRRLLADPATRVDAPDAAGRTALLHAVLSQHAAAVRLLIAAGADPGRADPAGLTPRAAARTGASAEIAALLAAPSP